MDAESRTTGRPLGLMEGAVSQEPKDEQREQPAPILVAEMISHAIFVFESDNLGLNYWSGALG